MTSLLLHIHKSDILRFKNAAVRKCIKYKLKLGNIITGGSTMETKQRKSSSFTKIPSQDLISSRTQCKDVLGNQHLFFTCCMPCQRGAGNLNSLLHLLLFLISNFYECFNPKWAIANAEFKDAFEKPGKNDTTSLGQMPLPRLLVDECEVLSKVYFFLVHTSVTLTYVMEEDKCEARY